MKLFKKRSFFNWLRIIIGLSLGVEVYSGCEWWLWLFALVLIYQGWIDTSCGGGTCLVDSIYNDHNGKVSRDI